MASKRRLRRKACEGKRKYSREEAATAARRLAFDKSTRVNEYNCPHCPFWHVGHPPKRMKAAMNFKRGQWDTRRSWKS